MDVPDIVDERLGDERATTRVNVGGEDWVYVTTARTLVYRAGGFLRNASVREFSHDAEALDVSAARRQATFAFTYAEDVRGFTVPDERVETILTPVLSGILATTGVTGANESVLDTYCFSDRTLVVTDARLLIHGGETVWSAAHREYAYVDVTEVRFEQGASTPVVLVMDDERRRIETPAEQARAVHRTVERAMAAGHDDAATEAVGTHEPLTQPETDQPVGANATTSTEREPTTEKNPTEPGRAAGERDIRRADIGPTNEGATDPEPTNTRPTTRPSPSPADGSNTAGKSDTADDSNVSDESNTRSLQPTTERAGRTDGAGEQRHPAEGANAHPSTDAPRSSSKSSEARSRPATSDADPRVSNETESQSGDSTPDAADAKAGKGTTTESGDGPTPKKVTRTEASPQEDTPPEETRTTEMADAGRPTGLDRDALVAELEALNETVAHQRDLIERQHDRIERLSEALDTE